MSYFATLVFLVVSVALLVTGWVQSGRVSWATDKCGCVGIWGLFMASFLMAIALCINTHVMDAAAGMVLAFALWMACRFMRKEHDKAGVFGETDKAILERL